MNALPGSLAMKRLIVNADDFGLAEGINQAVREAHLAGILTSATLIANGRAFDSAVRIARALPTLGVGIHLNLTQGKPAAPKEEIASLLDEQGEFKRGVTTLLWADLLHRIQPEEVKLEIRSQIEKVLQAGLVPTHVDGHKHFHFWPPFFSIVVNLAREYGIPAIRLAARPPGTRLSPPIASPGVLFQLLKQQGLELSLSILAGINQRLVFPPEMKRPDFLWGASHTGFLDGGNLRDLLAHVEEGVNELMCHPGYVDEGLAETPTRLLGQREIELQALVHPQTRDALNAWHIELIHYGNLVELKS
jgi:hopanoid biosynthesis associated protein HpnK